MTETERTAKAGVLLADDEYTIDVKEVDERTFTITLNNEAARRALGVGQTRAHDDSAGTLASALDGTLNAINEELTGRDWMLWTPVGITGNSDGTPYHVTIHVKNNEKLRVIEQCANSSGINRVETMRRLTTLALRLILFESRPPEDPDVHPMLSGNAPKTVH